MALQIDKILLEVIQRNASDLHLVQEYHPTLRVDGTLFQLKLYPPVSSQDITQFFLSVTNKEQQEAYNLNKELDFGIVFQNHRFRVNAYQEKDSIALSMRLIPTIIKNIQELALPPILYDFARLKQGLVLITGQAGQGKSTTVASIINEINLSEPAHIITIEDPIEFLYSKGKAIISQREVKRDTLSFNRALKSVLREDPDIIVVGELRDLETISAALTIAETGHLVFSTLHTNTASQTIDRIIDVFPEEQQAQIKTQLSNVLKGIICQRLLPKAKSEGRIVCCEVLVNNTAVASLIREGKTFQIDNVIQTSAEERMVLFETSLKDLFLRGLIDKETALEYAFRPKLIRELLT